MICTLFVYTLKDSATILTDGCCILFILAFATKYTPLKANSVGNFYRIIRKRAGIDNSKLSKNGRGACLHCFRHTFAVRSFDKNERCGISAKDSIPFLSTYLGHDSLYETEKYLKYSGDYFADTLAKFDAFTSDLFPEVNIYE